MAVVAFPTSMATGDVEVWPEYPLPLFLELSGLQRCIAVEEARQFRRLWVQSSWNFAPNQPFSEFLGRRTAAIDLAAAAAAKRLADNAALLHRLWCPGFIFDSRPANVHT